MALLTLAILPTLFAGALFPALRLLFLVPPLIWLYYRLPFSMALWASFGAGLLVDLLSSDYRFGMFALTYTATSGLLYAQKRHFYLERWSTLPLLTTLFALLSTVIIVVLLALVDDGLLITWRWVITDLALFPLADAAWALVGFAIPMKLILWQRTVRRPYRLKRPK